MDAARPIALAFFVACSSPRPPPSEALTPAIAVPPMPKSAEPSASADAAPAAPTELREPGEVACRIAGVGWRSERLRLRAGGPIYARADRVPATLALPVTMTPSEAVVTMDDGRVLVRAVLRASITTKKGLARRDVIHDGAPLAASPTASPAAELNADVPVELLETRGGQARILIDERSVVVSGWVAQKDLGPPALRGVAGIAGVGGERAYGLHRLYLMHCPGDIAVFVELGSERMKVGTIRKGAGFRPASAGDAGAEAFRSIELPDSPWLRLETGARLVVEASSLGACRQDSPGF